MHDDITTPIEATAGLRVTREDLPSEPERIVIRAEDLDTAPLSPAGQVWVAVDFSSLGWVPAHFAVPDHVPVGDFDLRPFVPGVAVR